MMRDGGDWWQTGWGFAGQFVMDGGAQVFVASHPCDSLFLEKQSQQWGTEHWLLGRFDSETWKTTNPNQPRPWEERQPLGLRLPTIADNALVQTAQLHTKNDGQSLSIYPQTGKLHPRHFRLPNSPLFPMLYSLFSIP